MNEMQFRSAKARLSAVLDDAERGEPTTITRHGKPVAVVVPLDDAKRIYQTTRPSIIDVLLQYPGGLELEPDDSTLPEIDLE